MFDRIAPRYDLLNRVLSAGTDVRWRRAAVDLLDPPARACILDLCTGTADLLREALGREGGRRGLGLDLSREMLRRGAHKLAQGGLAARSALAQADAERLPVRAESCDGALVAFGIRNVADPVAALREVRRVLKPGGRLVVLEFAMPRGLLGALYRFYFRGVLPRLGGLVSGDRAAYAYLPASVELFPTPQAFAELLAQSGFEGVRLVPLTGGIAYLYRAERGR
jgi:demethylmenaquinone methyltransferase/2-methoxy-6-polyprenyl-1,4-benzoquinol methylase